MKKLTGCRKDEDVTSSTKFDGTSPVSPEQTIQHNQQIYQIKNKEAQATQPTIHLCLVVSIDIHLSYHGHDITLLEGQL